MTTQDALRDQQIGALKRAFGARMKLTAGGNVLIDGLDVSDALNEDVVREFDRRPEDIVDRVLVALGEYAWPQ
jgi:hypothetical protein